MSDVRRNEDLDKLRVLCGNSGGKLSIVKTYGTPVQRIELLSKYTTAKDESYPNSVTNNVRIEIELPPRYPFSEPVVQLKDPVLHPNVWKSGRICLGKKWLPTDKLDLFVKRVLSIITYDPSYIDESSPANSEAVTWYRKARNQHPSKFPTDRIAFVESTEKPKMSWNNIK